MSDENGNPTPATIPPAVEPAVSVTPAVEPVSVTCGFCQCVLDAQTGDVKEKSLRANSLRTVEEFLRH